MVKSEVDYFTLLKTIDYINIESMQIVNAKS